MDTGVMAWMSFVVGSSLWKEVASNEDREVCSNRPWKTLLAIELRLFPAYDGESLWSSKQADDLVI